MDPRRSTAVFSLLRRGAFVSLLGIGGGWLLLVVVVPQFLGTGERSRTAPCDNLYVALNGEVANELDVVLRGGTTACGTTSGPEAVIDCTLGAHAEERDPLFPERPAYARAEEVLGAVDSCRVGLAPLGTNGIRFHQWVRPDSTTSRTFSVVID